MSPTYTGTPVSTPTPGDPATPKLFDLAYRVARNLNIASEGIATGGSTTTLIDTLNRSEDDDFWNGGSVFILKDSGGLGVAPEGEFSRVTDHASSSQTVTIQALTAAIGAQDRYAIALPDVPLDQIIQKINAAISTIYVAEIDTTSLTIVADQLQYTLPVHARDLREVWIQADTAHTDVWAKISNWEIDPSDPGIGHKLILPYYFDEDRKLKLVYVRRHDPLYAASDKLHDSVLMDPIVAIATHECLLWLRSTRRTKEYDNDIAIWKAAADEARATIRVTLPKRRGRIGIITTANDYPTVEAYDPNRVRL